jgi:hypothetical protein
MKVDANGHVYVQIQSKLVEHDAYGQYLKTHDVRDMGVVLFLGSFAFFSNGDVLFGTAQHQLLWPIVRDRATDRAKQR